MLSAELKVRSGKHSGKIIPLRKGKFLIGRGEDCHLRPNNDMISRHHCVFTVDDYAVVLKDLGSTNGTQVNDETIKGRVVLQSGDTVAIGKLIFEVEINEAAETANVEVPQAVGVIDGNGSDVPLEGGQATVDPLSLTEEHLPGEQTPAQTSDANETAIMANDETAYIPPENNPANSQQPPPAPPLQYAPGTYPPQYPYMPQQGPYPPQGQYPPPYPMQQPIPGMTYPPQPGYPPQYPPVPGAYPGYPQGYPAVPPAPADQTQPQVPPPETEQPAEAATEKKKAFPEISLPDPDETGVRDEEASSGGAKKAAKKGSSEPSPSTNAADIIRQMAKRRPT